MQRAIIGNVDPEPKDEADVSIFGTPLYGTLFITRPEYDTFEFNEYTKEYVTTPNVLASNVNYGGQLGQGLFIDGVIIELTQKNNIIETEVIDAKALANVVSVDLPKERLPFLTLEYLIKESIDNIDAIYAEKEKQIGTVKKVIEDTKQLGIAAISKITTTKNVALNASRGLFGLLKKGLHWLMEDSDDMKKVEQNVAKFNGAINNNKIAENDTAKMAVAMKVVKQDYQYVILKIKVHQANVDKCLVGLLKIVHEC